MNTYTTTFSATCPVNKARIGYTLVIHSITPIPVEEILLAVSRFDEGLHEEIADELFARLGGEQHLAAFHHGVRIDSVRPYVSAPSARS